MMTDIYKKDMYNENIYNFTLKSDGELYVKMSPKDAGTFTFDYNSPYPNLCHLVPVKIIIDCFRELYKLNLKYTESKYIISFNGPTRLFISLDVKSFGEQPIRQWKQLENISEEFSYYNGPYPYTCIKIVDYVIVQFIHMILNKLDGHKELKQEILETIKETKQSKIKVIQIKDMKNKYGYISYNYDIKPSCYHDLLKQHSLI